MKKSFLVLTILIISISASCQEGIAFEKVIQAEGMNKDELFIKLNEWFASNYKSANDVLQMVDKDAGVIVGKGSMNYFHKKKSSYNGNLNYTIKTYVKDNRYKVLLSDFNHSGLSFDLGLITSEEIYTNKGIYKKYHNQAWSDIKLKIKQYSYDIFNSFENKTKKDNDMDIGDDW